MSYPSNPSTGDIFTISNVSYYYDGADWVLLSSITIDPAINAVQSTGSVTIDNLTVTGTLTADVDVAFDTNTFFVDSDLNRVGINQQSPQYALDVTGQGRFTAGIIGDLTGNVSGNLTGNVTGNVSGNAGTATALQTARTITIDGDVDGSASFDGTSNITITTTVDNNSHSHTNYVPLAGGTMTGELQVNARLDVGDGTNGNHEIRIYKADNDVSDHIQFYNGTTRIGEIGAEDNTWLRINQETAKNIYTPRYMRADGGFFVDGSTYGINGTGGGVFNGNSSTTGSMTADIYYSSNNGNGTNYRIGDDAWVGDTNVANTIRIKGVQNADRGYIRFGNSNYALGQVGTTGALTWSGSISATNGTLSRVTPCTSIDRVHDVTRTAGGTHTVTLGTSEGGVAVSGATGVFLTVTADSYNGNSGFGEVKPYGQGTTVNGSCMNWDVGNTSQAGVYVSLDSSRRFRYYISSGARVIIDVTGFTF